MRNFIKENKGISLMGVIVAVALVAVFTIGLWAPFTPPPAGPVPALAGTIPGISARPYWQQKWNYFSGTACETITVGQALTMNTGTGEIGLADCDAGASDYVVGLAGTAAGNGESVQVVRSGILAGLEIPINQNTGITPYGSPVYLANVAGGITSYPVNWAGGVTLFVGTAITKSDYAVDNSGTTANGTDRILVNIPFSSGVTVITDDD